MTLEDYIRWITPLEYFNFSRTDQKSQKYQSSEILTIPSNSGQQIDFQAVHLNSRFQQLACAEGMGCKFVKKKTQLILNIRNQFLGIDSWMEIQIKMSM